MMEPGRKCRLGCYTKFAIDLLVEALGFFANDINYSVHVALDNEAMYVEWENAPILDKSLRQRVAKALKRYSEQAESFTFPMKYVEAAPCLRLIVLQRDAEAKAKWPEIYEKLKGKPLNAIQTMAVETLLAEADRLDEWDSSVNDGLAHFSMRYELRDGIPYKELSWMFSKEKRRIFRKICKIRGW